MNFFVFFLFILTATHGFSFSIHKEVEALPSAPVFQKPQLFTLPDGLTLIVEEDHSLPIASVQACCATGSIHEGAHLGSGMSHVLEHMLFKGTTHRTPGSIYDEVRKHGGYINANTSYEKTIFNIETPSSEVSYSIDILADMMMNASFPCEEYTKEQEVIRQEIAMRSDDLNTMRSELLFRTVFHVHPFREPIEGYLDIYNQLTRADVIAYYKRRYVPNNLCFIVVGDVNAEKIRQQLAALFQKQPRRSLEPIVIPSEPQQCGKRVARDTFSTTLSHINMAWRLSSPTYHDFPALAVLAAIIGTGNSSPLNQELHEKKELVHQIEATLNQEGLFCITAIADLKKRDAAETEILKQLEIFKTKSVTAAELNKAKQELLSSRFHFLETTLGRASDYAHSWVVTGDPCFYQHYFEAIKNVTALEVKQVAEKYLTEDKLTLTSLDPNSVKAVETATIGKASLVEAPAIQKFTLPNGLRLLIHEDHRLPLVSLVADFRGGTLVEDPKNNGLTHLLASTITQGTRSKTAGQIAQILEQAGGSIKTHSNSDSLNISVNVMQPHLNLGLDLLAEVLNEAIFPEAKVDREKMMQLASIKEEACQNTSVAQWLIKENLFGIHPYALPSIGREATVSILTSKMLKTYYKQLVVGRNGVIAIFGDVKSKDVLAAATKAFANMPAGTLACSSIPEAIPLTASVNAQKILPTKQSIIKKGFLGITVTSVDRPALELLSAACSNMGSRFYKQLREKKALVYYMSTFNAMGLARGDFTFCLAADPKKIDLARQELNRGIDELIVKGLTQDELDQAKKIILRADAFRMQSNASFASSSANDELMGLGYDYYQHHTEKINGMTLAAINQSIRKYLGVPGSVEVIVGPTPTTAPCCLPR